MTLDVIHALQDLADHVQFLVNQQGGLGGAGLMGQTVAATHPKRSREVLVQLGHVVVQGQLGFNLGVALSLVIGLGERVGLIDVVNEVRRNLIISVYPPFQIRKHVLDGRCPQPHGNANIFYGTNCQRSGHCNLVRPGLSSWRSGCNKTCSEPEQPLLSAGKWGWARATNVSEKAPNPLSKDKHSPELAMG